MFNRRVIMPTIYSDLDRQWIENQMLILDPGTRAKIALKYAEVYEQTFDSEPVQHKRENRARHEANTRLRVFVDRYAAASVGYTQRPPEVKQ